MGELDAAHVEQHRAGTASRSATKSNRASISMNRPISHQAEAIFVGREGLLWRQTPEA